MTRRDIIDSATAELLQAERSKRKRRSLTSGARRKAQRDEGRNKATYDLPITITQRITEIAEAEGCPKSGVAAVFLVEAIRRYEDGELDLTPFKLPSDSPKYEYVIEVAL